MTTAIRLPPCPRCGGTFGQRDDDGDLRCLLCGEVQLPPGTRPERPLPLVANLHLKRTGLR